jgi:serine/threonine protein kinase
VDHSRCPDDGTLLSTQKGDSSLEAILGGDTTIDLHGRDSQEDVLAGFDETSSDIRTFLVHRPTRDMLPVSTKRTKSSDPPTTFVRRAESHIELPPGALVDETYEIESRLGAGAMGEVYAARHVKLDKRVAIKVISPRLSKDTAAVERFVQEARTLAQMHHPGLVDVLDFGELADRRAYFVMELLTGMSLYDRLKRGRMEANEALELFSQMVRALEAAHAHGVVHRDLKPENIFLTRVMNEPRPTVKLLDFGLARLEVGSDRRAERTQSGVVIGTAMYLSPEQARGPDVDGRTDIYALGCVAYEMFLGRHPFQDMRTVVAMIAAHMHEPPPLPRSIDPAIPRDLDRLLLAMVAKDAAQRATIPQIRSALERVRAGPVKVTVLPSPPPAPSFSSAAQSPPALDELKTLPRALPRTPLPAPATVGVSPSNHTTNKASLPHRAPLRSQTEHVSPRTLDGRVVVIVVGVMLVATVIGVMARQVSGKSELPLPSAARQAAADAGIPEAPPALIDAYVDDAVVMSVTPETPAGSIDAGVVHQPSAAVAPPVDAGSVAADPEEFVPPPTSAPLAGERAPALNDSSIKPRAAPVSSRPRDRTTSDTPNVPAAERDQPFNPFKKSPR